MKHLQKIIVTMLLISMLACTNDEKFINSKDEYYKITSFEAVNSRVDLNNDGIGNSNFKNELTNYSEYPYDLEVKLLKSQVLFSFYLPEQYIDFDCCPSGFVEFANGGFTLLFDKNFMAAENIEIDNDNYVNELTKINNNQYKLILSKKYFDFINSKSINIGFEILFDRIIKFE